MIIFYNEVKKADAISTAVEQLHSFINPRVPDFAQVLVNTWQNQGKAITYKELREAIMQAYDYGGVEEVELFERLIAEWRQDYSIFVMRYVAPAWVEAIEEANSRLRRRFPDWTWDGFADGIKEWTDTAAAQFVTNVTAEQIGAIREAVRLATQAHTMGVDELGRVIRPMVGLNQRQARATWNYYNKLLETGVKERRAVELATRYSARQSRYRGQMIARTELGFAYNQGAHMGVKAAQSANLMGPCRKRWCIAKSERNCEVCKALDGKIIEMDDEFNFHTNLTYPGIRLHPPAHPHCMCGVLYEEIAPPDFSYMTN